MRHIFGLFLALSTIACTSQVKEKQLSSADEKAYLNLVYQKCPKADILEIETEEDYVEVEYLCNGELFEVGITGGKIIFQETKADRKSIEFQKIKHKLEKKYSGWILDEVLLVTTEDTSFLKVEIIKDGLEQNLFFALDGKWYKAKSIVASDSWNTINLSENKTMGLAHYKFLVPDNTYEMPDLLREISGITLGSNGDIYCVQDELGIVFQYNMENEAILAMHRFTDVGDFEDLARVGEDFYVLRSDGSVFNFNIKKNGMNASRNVVPVNSLNIEGLFYNPRDENMYMACKEPLLGAEESKRMIYTYAVNTPYQPKPYLEINLIEIADFFKKNYPEIERDNVLFNPSAVAIHPVTNDVYVLSAADRLLAVYGNNKLQNVYPLPAELYYKPEGLAFYSNGDLLISSEGDKRGLMKGTIFRLRYKP